MTEAKTQKVVLIEETGDSFDVLKSVSDFPVPQLNSPFDVVIKNKYAGVNFIEAYFRKGIYPSEKPYILGREASGEVVAAGSDVSDYSVGDKVVYLSDSTFAQYTKVDLRHAKIAKLRSDTSEKELELYGGLLLQGLTAITFVNEAHNVKKGEYTLIWAAAGGVGQLLVQLASLRGAHVIAIASSDEKLKIAKKLGAEYLINSSKDDIAKEVLEITKGSGVLSSFDSSGKDTVDISLQVLSRKGSFVSYGNSSGAIPPFDVSRLGAKNLKLLRPRLFGYIHEKSEWEKYTEELLELISSQKLKLEITKVYDLFDYKSATADLEGRKTTGKLVLRIPQ